ncbi:hypothetical protein LX32DRAFT_223240 [Colletotrichum zoysiae]|uniref:Uncharacterized protein n=1 Tax=Colletotrichum zoysiae TaxID=1216348 RepID=A0AAD9LXH5_9PEZI|nr:hypothetical protein LX32DRAFT_223240 [Colletotrichum zoysiae]
MLRGEVCCSSSPSWRRERDHSDGPGWRLTDRNWSAIASKSTRWGDAALQGQWPCLADVARQGLVYCSSVLACIPGGRPTGRLNHRDSSTTMKDNKM